MTEYRLNAYHIMWLFVFFDLPVSTKKEMKAATLFGSPVKPCVYPKIIDSL